MTVNKVIRKIKTIDAEPTPAQLKFYNKLKGEWCRKGHLKINEACALFGWNNPTSFYKHLNALEKKGWLIRGYQNTTIDFLK